MLQCQLRKVLVVELHIAPQRISQILARLEAISRQDVADPAVEALNHLVCLQDARLGQTVLDAERSTSPVEFVLAAAALAVLCGLNRTKTMCIARSIATNK